MDRDFTIQQHNPFDLLVHEEVGKQPESKNCKYVIILFGESTHKL